MRADDSEAISSELFRTRWTNEKSHIAPRLSQPATKVTTHRTGADDKDPQIHQLSYHSLGLRTASVNAQSNQLGIQLFRGGIDLLILQSTHQGRRKIVGHSSCPGGRLFIDHQSHRNIQSRGNVVLSRDFTWLSNSSALLVDATSTANPVSSTEPTADSKASTTSSNDRLLTCSL